MSEAPFIVRPKPGRRVLHPRSFRPIPPEGQDVSDERLYFLRRLKNGEVELVPAASPVPAKPSKPARRD